MAHLKYLRAQRQPYLCFAPRCRPLGLCCLCCLVLLLSRVLTAQSSLASPVPAVQQGRTEQGAPDSSGTDTRPIPQDQPGIGQPEPASSAPSSSDGAATTPAAPPPGAHTIEPAPS